VSTVFIAK